MVASSGGDVQTLRFGLAEHEFVDAISPDGAELVVGAWTTDGSVMGDVPYWLVPLVRGAPRRLDDVLAHGSCWLPDGRLLYAYEHDLYTIDRHGRGKALLASVGGKAYWPRVSPDGRRVRFARFSSTTTFRVEALWEIDLDDRELRPLLPGWNDPPAECCGEWTPDGSYYVFQSTRNGETHLWARREKGAWPLSSVEPVQLTSGPVQFRRPVFSRDGRTLFANGWQTHGELTRFDPRSGAVAPYAPSLSAEWLTHSPDGRWIAYVTYPEGELWRARADGSARLRLTAPGMRACCGRISPGASHVALVGQSGDASARTYVVAMDGSDFREIAGGGEATWSPDGGSLVVSTGSGLVTVTIEGRVVGNLPGSDGLVSPVWSPDGKRLAAVRADSGRLHVFEIDRARWRQLPSLSVAFPNWSRDSRSLYFLTGRPAPGVIDTISRWHVDSDRVERLLELASYRLAWGITNHWLGLAPDDAPLFLRELSTHELYALEWHP
jgi:Tol biopolymer transport system component